MTNFKYLSVLFTTIFSLAAIAFLPKNANAVARRCIPLSSFCNACDDGKFYESASGQSLNISMQACFTEPAQNMPGSRLSVPAPRFRCVNLSSWCAACADGRFRSVSGQQSAANNPAIETTLLRCFAETNSGGSNARPPRVEAPEEDSLKQKAGSSAE